MSGLKIINFHLSFFLSIKISMDGKTKSAATRAINIMIAVSIPNDENIGMGANPIMMNPNMVETAEPNNAKPD